MCTKVRLSNLVLRFRCILLGRRDSERGKIFVAESDLLEIGLSVSTPPEIKAATSPVIALGTPQDKETNFVPAHRAAIEGDRAHYSS